MAVGAEAMLEDKYNFFEFIIAVASIVSFFSIYSYIIQVEITQRRGVSIISILRALKLLKYLKNDYSWDNFRVLVVVVFEGFPYVTGFMAILVY